MDETQTKVPPIGGEAASPESVAARLSTTPPPAAAPEVSGKPEVKEPTPSEPAPAFDISKLTPEQLVVLKGMLDSAPLRSVKKGNPIIKMRRLNGRIILDFGNCFQTLVRDEQANANIEKVMIPVKFMDAAGKPEAKFINVDYRDFMNSDQIKCEIVSTRRVPGSYSEGQVESNERPGVMVEMEVKTVHDFFTIKLPEGSAVPQVEIEAKIANA